MFTPTLILQILVLTVLVAVATYVLILALRANHQGGLQAEAEAAEWAGHLEPGVCRGECDRHGV